MKIHTLFERGPFDGELVTLTLTSQPTTVRVGRFADAEQDPLPCETYRLTEVEEIPGYMGRHFWGKLTYIGPLAESAKSLIHYWME